MRSSFNGKIIQIVEPEKTGSEREPSLLFIHGAGCNASSRLITIPEAGHLVMTERPGAANQAIEDFLSELP
jgi:alpha-beta hydrolase superfamily lysophospholipase